MKSSKGNRSGAEAAEIAEGIFAARRTAILLRYSNLRLCVLSGLCVSAVALESEYVP